jgi:hypothetical protein
VPMPGEAPVTTANPLVSRLIAPTPDLAFIMGLMWAVGDWPS